MTQIEIKQIVCKIIADVGIKRELIVDDVALGDDMGMDSLDLGIMLSYIDKKFNIEFPDLTFEVMRKMTLQDVVEIVEKEINN